MRHIFYILLALILASCSSEKKMMDSWLGDTKQDLILKWGPPERTASDGGGGEVLVYSNQVYNPYTRNTIYQCRMFYVDSDGKIYHWLKQGSLVPPQEMNVNLYVH
jgi:hypothetical protein